MFEPNIYKSRRERLKGKVANGLILLLGNVDVPMNYKDNTYHFRQDSSFLYYWGLDFQGLAGIIDVNRDEEILLGDDVDIEDIIWMGPQVSLRENAAKVGCNKTAAFAELFTRISEAISQGRKIHFLPPYRAENKLLLQELLGIHPAKQKEYSSLELVKAVIAMRSVKEACEVEEIKKACAIGYDMHVKAMKMAMPGTWEQSISGALEGIANSSGNGPSYPIILSQHGEILHNHNHDEILQEGRLMLVDAGASSLMHYASDFTRTTPVGGKFTQKQREIYEIVLAANNHATSLTKAGTSYLSIHLAAAEVITSGLKELGLMKGDVKEAVKNGAHALFMPHGLGHMMGLDVHDMEDLGQIYVGYDDEIRPVDQFGTAYLRLGKKLEAGYVLTNEPGIYFIPALIEKWKAEKTNTDFINFDKLESYLNFGGIRLEDNLLVTKTGCEILGQRVPITPEDVEATMNS
ncbi:aminopeptidase P family protein [Mangrovibacterium diazotrophicum]|uniref:Xaa-Pro aminopeptidase n=1 Tax=Mangrovibacterium diazotrophicum TaxID=1261403 RepID=A0A419VWH3_9BACT|nr:aminopeptidase P family protein [Mangrovibacterium diazotrophicum]RKD86509.1 Xaa-Pro aminopeptidase [Mangrovibacterium diazotrophicum]